MNRRELIKAIGIGAIGNGTIDRSGESPAPPVENGNSSPEDAIHIRVIGSAQDEPALWLIMPRGTPTARIPRIIDPNFKKECG